MNKISLNIFWLILIFAWLLIFFLTKTKSFEIQNVIASPALAYQEAVMNFGSAPEDQLILTQGALLGQNAPEVVFDPQNPPQGQISTFNRISVGKEEVILLAYGKVVKIWGEKEWEAFYDLEVKEAGWKVGNINPISGACGLGQSLPCNKMPVGCLYNAECELDWMNNYILQRYKTPTNALYFWNYIAPQINGNNWY